MTRHSAKYVAYMRSPEWQAKRAAVLHRANSVCERCTQARATDVHHLTYDRLGREPLEDLQALCHPCHERADRERDRAMRERSYWRRFDGWMDAQGLDASQATEYDEERFERFLERRETR